MRTLKRTGKTERTSVGYARRDTTITVTDDEAKALLKEGGWEEVKGGAQRSSRQTQAGGRQAGRVTEVPEPQKAAANPNDAGSAGSSGDEGEGGEDGDDAASSKSTRKDAKK